MNGENEKMTLHKLMSTLNAEITAGTLENRDQKEIKADTDHRPLGRFICVQVAGTELAIKLSTIIEAGELSSIRSLPLLPIWLPGITNIRGNIISVVDLGCFLGISQPLSSKTQSFLMVSNDSLKLAITVQRIHRTRILYQREHVQPDITVNDPSPIFMSKQAWYKQDDQWNSIAMFDLELFLSSNKLLQMAA